MEFEKFLIKNINYPLAMILTGRGMGQKYLKDSLQNQYRSYETNIMEQRDRLYDIVSYAVCHVPYYREYVRKNEIQFSRENIQEDFKQFPILTKEMIRNEKEKLFSDESIDYIISTSGGSTGEPVQLRHDKSLALYNAGLYFLSYAGYEIGDKIILLWGSERDILQGGIGVKAKIVNTFIKRRKLLNSFMMTQEDMGKFVQIINKWKPKVIQAYTQSIYELSLFIQQEGLEIYSPDGIVVSAGTLYSDWKKKIQEVFRCPIFNQYGSRETPGIAISCAKDSQLHINTFLNYVEVVDDWGESLPYDIDGNILVTNLVNRSMPILRYKIGDIGSLSSKKN